MIHRVTRSLDFGRNITAFISWPLFCRELSPLGWNLTRHVDKEICSRWRHYYMSIHLSIYLSMPSIYPSTNSTPLRSQLCLLHESLEVLFALLHLVGLLLPLLIRPGLDEVLELVLAFPRRQQQVPLVEHDLVQLLFPRRKCRNLDIEKQFSNFKPYIEKGLANFFHLVHNIMAMLGRSTSKLNHVINIMSHWYDIYKMIDWTK